MARQRNASKRCLSVAASSASVWAGTRVRARAADQVPLASHGSLGYGAKIVMGHRQLDPRLPSVDACHGMKHMPCTLNSSRRTVRDGIDGVGLAAIEIYTAVGAEMSIAIPLESRGEQMATQPEPEMTAEEREQFERNELHHEDENVDRSSGPASEPDLRSDKPLPPDAGAIKR